MRYASVRTPVLGWLSCLLLVACSGRSSLNDFANGSTDTVKGRPGNGDAGGNNGANDDAGGNGADEDGGGSGGNGNANSGDDEGQIGDPCSDAEDCVGRSATCLEELSIFSILTIEFPGGYCAQSDCEDDSDCPDGARCFSSIPNQTFCAKSCDRNSDCRTSEGYECGTAPLSQETTTYCLPPINIPGGGGGGTTRG